MRVSELLCAAAVVACLYPSNSPAETAAQRRAAAMTSEEQSEPYHKHHDTRHGHDHYYPDRGAIVRDLPVGTIGTSYAGVSYRYHDGIWLEPRGPAYMVVAPPVGLVAPTLPLFSTVVKHGADSFLYCNDTYYRPRPDLDGYEVVNDPNMESGPLTAPTPDALVGGQMPSVPAVAVAGGTAAPSPEPTTVAAPSAAATVVPVVARESGLAGGAMPSNGSGPASTPTAAATPVVLGSSIGQTVSTSEIRKAPKVILYPKNGQSADQQARDRYDCYRFAVAQSGFDPMRTGAAAAGSSAEQQSDFERAQGACFEGRGYSNR